MVEVSPEIREKQEWLRKVHTFSPALPEVYNDILRKHQELMTLANLYGEDAVKSYAATIYIHPGAFEFNDALSRKYLGKGFFDAYVDHVRDAFREAGLGDFEKYVVVRYPVKPKDEHTSQYQGLSSDFVGVQFIPKSPRHFVHVVTATGRFVSKLMDLAEMDSVLTSRDILNKVLMTKGLEIRLDPEQIPDDVHRKLAYTAMNVHEVPGWYIEWLAKHRPADDEILELLHDYVHRKVRLNDSRFLQLLDFARKFPEIQNFVHPRALVELGKLYSDRGKRAYVRPVSSMKSIRVHDILDNLRKRRELFAGLGPLDFRKLANALSLLDKGDPHMRALALLGHPHVDPEDLVRLLRSRDREQLADDLSVFLKHGSLDAVAKSLSFSKTDVLQKGVKGNVSTFKTLSIVRKTPAALAAERILRSAGISPRDDPHAFLSLVNAIKRSNLDSKILALPEDVVRFELGRTGVVQLIPRFFQTKSPSDLLSILSRLKASRLGEYEQMLRHEVRDDSGSVGAASSSRLSIDPFIDLIDSHPALEQVRKGISSLSEKKRAALLLYHEFGGDINKAWVNHQKLKRVARKIVQELSMSSGSQQSRSSAVVESVRTPDSRQAVDPYLVSGATAAVLKLKSILGDSANVYVDKHGNLVFDTSRVLAKHSHEETHALKTFQYLQPFNSFHHERRGERVVIPAEQIDSFIAALHNLAKHASGDSAREIQEFVEALRKIVAKRS